MMKRIKRRSFIKAGSALVFGLGSVRIGAVSMFGYRRAVPWRVSGNLYGKSRAARIY
jgi:hypothetical protein